MARTAETVIVLTNQTTATRYLYAVSPAIAGLIRFLPYERLSEAMPRQTPYGKGYEQVAYAMALVDLAHEMGIEDADIAVMPIAAPVATFETGWAEKGDPTSDDAGEEKPTEEPDLPDCFPSQVRVPLDDVCRQVGDIDGLKEVLGSQLPLSVVPHSFGVEPKMNMASAMDRLFCRFFFTAYEDADGNGIPDEGKGAFATYAVSQAKAYDDRIFKLDEFVLERVHVGRGLRGAEGFRGKESASLVWGDGAAQTVLEVWCDIVGTADAD